MLRKLRKAQGSLEYAALIGVVVGAVILMNTYMKRSVQGRLRSSADDIGDQYDLEKGGYSYTSDLQDGKKDVTYSAVGTKEGDTDLSSIEGLDWLKSSVKTGEGSQVQFTTEAGGRITSEQIATDETKITE